MPEFFNIIRHRGEPKEAQTLKGRKVVREQALLVPEWGQYVPCAPYDNHFIYADQTPGQSSYMCTCGSPGVVINEENERARLFVCLLHATSGSHATSYINLKDFPNVAGRTIDIKGQR